MRVPGLQADVIVKEDLREEKTESMGGVRQAVTYGDEFSSETLCAEAVERIRQRRYDFCVVPYIASDGSGFENVTPLAQAGSAGCAVWINVKSNCELPVGSPQGWEPAYTSTEGDPFQDLLRLGRGLTARLSCLGKGR